MHVTPEEKRQKAAERSRLWRAANRERHRAYFREWQENWQAEHPEETRDYFQKWHDEHPESWKAAQQRQTERRKHLRATDEAYRLADNAKRRALQSRWKGIPETELHVRFAEANPQALSMDRIRPDFYIPGDGFVEIKRALPFKVYNWRGVSTHFPGLFFLKPNKTSRWASWDVDEQISLQPRPLLVVVYHAITGEELARQSLT